MNKKLLKSIVCIVAGVGIATSIPFATTSCGCSSEGNKSLPNSVYDIDENNVLLGFKEGIDLNQYDGVCDTIQIPANVTEVNGNAFFSTSTSTTTIPPFITKLIFPKNSKCSGIYANAFRKCTSLTSVSFLEILTVIDIYAFNSCSSLVSVTFPDSLRTIGNNVFSDCSSLISVIFLSSLSTVGELTFFNCRNLSSITWDSYNDNPSLKTNSFRGVCPTGGNVIVTKPSVGHDSDALLRYLLDNGGLPQSWAKN